MPAHSTYHSTYHRTSIHGAAAFPVGHRMGLRRRPFAGSSLVRRLALLALAGLAVPLYLRIRAVADVYLRAPGLLLWPLLGVTLVAVAGCGLVLATRPNRTRRGRYVEVALIVALGLAFRVVFVTAPPALSHDAYRYVWDAHLVAHGVSPYTHLLSDPSLISLRDSSIWPQVNWRNSPTIYPPGAQIFYLLVNAVAPLNVQAMKLAMGVCDILCGLLTLVLLRRHGLDPRRAIAYWWNPIPVLEFFYSGHVDALATAETLAAVLLVSLCWRGSRTLAGVLLGFAALTKLYPLLFALVLLQPGSPVNLISQGTARPVAFHSRLRLLGPIIRANRGFLSGLVLTMALVPLPFLRLGLGSGGFLGTYFSQRFVDQGIVFRLITQVFVFAPAQFALQGIFLAGSCLFVAWRHLRRGLSVEAGVLAVSAAWIAVSPHLFPWYVGGLLPFLTLYLRVPPLTISAGPPLGARRIGVRRTLGEVRFQSSHILPAVLWLFVLVMPFTYVIFAPSGDADLFPWFSIVPALLAAAPFILHASPSLTHRGKWIHRDQHRDQHRSLQALVPRTATISGRKFLNRSSKE